MEVPREIVSDIIKYFRNYEDEEYKGMGIGSKDIQVHKIMYGVLKKKIEEIRKKTSDENEEYEMIDEYMDKIYRKTEKKYGFNEFEHQRIWGKIVKHSSYKSKEKDEEIVNMIPMIYLRTKRRDKWIKEEMNKGEEKRKGEFIRKSKRVCKK